MSDTILQTLNSKTKFIFCKKLFRVDFQTNTVIYTVFTFLLLLIYYICTEFNTNTNEK